MKQTLKEIRDMVHENEAQISHAELLANNAIYNALALRVLGNDNADLFCSYMAAGLFYYFKIPRTQDASTFINTFYNTYSLYQENLILISVSSEKSTIYDSSIESRIARGLAIGEKIHFDFVGELERLIKKILDNK